MFNIARTELHRLFLSPLAWVIMALSQLLFAYLFLSNVDFFSTKQSQLAAIPGAPGVTELVAMPLISNIGLILLLLTPLFSMRSFAEEHRNQTLPLLASAPLSSTDIVLGKFIGGFSFFIFIALLAMLMPLSLLVGTSLDFYLISAGLLGLLLLTASFMAIGVFLSSLTHSPAIAAVSSFALLFLLWIIDWAGQNSVTALSWLSLLRHFEPMLKGQVQTMDICFFLIVIVSFLLLTIRKLDSERLN